MQSQVSEVITAIREEEQAKFLEICSTAATPIALVDDPKDDTGYDTIQCHPVIFWVLSHPQHLFYMACIIMSSIFILFIYQKNT